jgi:glycosyltransferase involved in cell wall biosynthesis
MTLMPPTPRMTDGSVSVVIPAFNSALTVAESVRSALDQSSPPAQVIVVDDGSTDDTLGRLKEFGDRVLYVTQTNAGVACARNTGIARATGDFVAFLDADDVWHPRKLEWQMQAFAAGGRAFGALGTGTFAWPASTMPDLAQIAPHVSEISWDQIAIRNPFTTSSMIVRRRVLDAAGPFDTDLRGPEDHDLWLRVAEASAVGILDAPLTGYRDAHGSLSKHAAQMERGMRRILEKLDEREAWGGRWLLRRASTAYADYSCAYMYAAAGEPRLALTRLRRSLLTYPVPYRKGTMRMRLARPKLLVALLLTLAGLRSGHAA